MSSSARSGATGRLLWALAIAVQTVGCVLAVPEIDHGGSCAFAGSSECATCLAKSCQTSIDACCNDPACSGDDGHSAVLDALDHCGNGDADGCSEGVGKGTTAAGIGVRTCLMKECKRACLANASVPVEWTCEIPRTNDNPCATCVYESCATSIDLCCGTTACSADSSIKKDLGACTSGDTAGCAFMTTKSDDGIDGKLRVCITQSCAKACLGDGRTHVSCNLYSGGAYCECQRSEKSSGPDCSVASVRGQCVLGRAGCSCGTYSCSQGSSALGECSCNFRGNGSSTRCRAKRKGEDGRCCVHHEANGVTCECKDWMDADSCGSAEGEYPVDSCDEEVVMERLDEVLVPKCSN